MRKKLYLLFALSLVLPATSSKAEAQVVYLRCPSFGGQ